MPSSWGAGDESSWRNASSSTEGQPIGQDQYGQYGQQPAAPQSAGAPASDPAAAGQSPYGAPPAYGQQPYGATPTYGAPAYGAPQPGYGAASWDTGAPIAPMSNQWTPAPKAGLFPLRPMAFGEIFSATFRLLRTTPAVTLGSAALIMGIATVVATVIPMIVAFWLSDRLTYSTADDQVVFVGSTPFWLILSFLPGLILTMIGSAALQAIIAQIVAAAAVTRRVTFREVWKLVWKHIWSLLAYYLLIGGGTLLVLGLLVGAFVLVITGLVSSGNDSGATIALTVITAIFVALGFIAASLWLTTKLLFVPAAIVLEGLGPIAAITRSWTLSKDYFWRTLGISLLVQAIVGAVSQVISGVFSFFFPLFMTFLVPTGSTASGQEGVVIVMLIIMVLVTTVLSVLISAMTTVLVSGNAVIMYTDLRMRKEGLNVHLQQVVDAHTEGREPGFDPWKAAPLAPMPPAAPMQWTAPPR